MNLRKKECPPQSINGIPKGLTVLKRAVSLREKGQIGWSVGLFSLLFLAIFLCVLLQIEYFRMISLYLEDTLAASNLASAVVDIEEFGITNKIIIKDSDTAYERYRRAVKGNLNLNEAWEGQEGGMIQGLVRIVNYIVYNVDGGEVTIYRYDENGLMTSWKDSIGNAAAPNGIRIESTSIYSEIAFTVKGLMGMEIQAHKGNLADIVK